MCVGESGDYAEAEADDPKGSYGWKADLFAVHDLGGEPCDAVTGLLTRSLAAIPGLPASPELSFPRLHTRPQRRGST